VPAERINIGSLSETWATAPREGVDAPLMVERSFEYLAHERDFDPVEEETRQLAKLAAPFRSILEVRRVGSVLEVVQERFVGLSSRHLVNVLFRGRRLLPLDVWLGLAEVLCRAWGSVPADDVTWRMVPTIASFGVDVRRRVQVFPEPDFSLALEVPRSSLSTPGPLVRANLENYSPEHVTQSTPAVDERSRVFSLATVLVELLTLDRPFRRVSQLATLQATLTEEPRWRASHHPHCPPALGQVLRRAMARRPADRPESLEVLQRLLLEAAGCAPASSQRIANVVLGVDPESVRRTLATLRAQLEFLPPSWRDGGIDVLEDQLLETLVPFEQLPVTRAPVAAESSSSPRVNLAGAGPVSPPRVNLATATPGPTAQPRVNLAPVRRPWWQAIWPFGRS
jgi:hypothetical protein